MPISLKILESSLIIVSPSCLLLESNSEYLFLWLQRIAIVANYKIQYKDKEKLFELVRIEHGDGDRSIFSQSVRGFKPIGYE
jgi:hypothetical protein